MSYVMIVDDDRTMAEAIADMVSLLDWQTHVVHSPRAAIEALRQASPALILMDLNMPGVDGFEVLRYIKRDPMWSAIPVAFITAEDDPSIVERAKEAGAADYLVKPVDFDRLESLLARLTRR